VLLEYGSPVRAIDRYERNRRRIEEWLSGAFELGSIDKTKLVGTRAASHGRLWPMPDRYDVVVVGGGTSGCVLASRLSERTDRSVLLLEAGPDYGPFAKGGWPKDILDARAAADESHDWGFNAASATRAKILGGCSSHNECGVVWAPPGDYRAWADLGDSRWGFEEQRPLLERAQTLLNTQAGRADEPDPLVEPFLTAVEELGFARLDHLNEIHTGSGGSRLPMNVRDGIRWNAAFAYLDQARDRPNLTIQADTLVDRVLFEGTAARGVAVDRAGQREDLAARTVIISAGTYMSPAILQRSGIGSYGDLDRLGVQRVLGLRGVADNLLDHPMVAVEFALDRSLDVPVGLQDVLLEYRSGFCSDEYWDTHVLLFVYADEGEQVEVIFYVAALQSDSVGGIRLPAADPHVLPELTQPFSSLTDHDTAVLVERIRTVRRLAQTKALRRFLGTELAPGQDDDLETYVRSEASGYWHPVGTCRAGRSEDPWAVVDSTGRVHGATNLVVADASIFPTIPRANTNLPTIGIAEFIASTIP
jgi:choline dehydrogenase-like flavoprotein